MEKNNFALILILYLIFWMYYFQHWKDEETGEYKFRCQFGPDECRGNKIHACSIRYITDQHKLADYIHCMIHHNRHLVQTAVQCSQTHQVPWETIYNCSKVARSYCSGWKVKPQFYQSYYILYKISDLFRLPYK